MLLVGHWRHGRAVIWSVLIGVWLFCAGFILVAPLGCPSTVVSRVSQPGFNGPVTPVVGTTSCTNIIGIHYAGPTPYYPSLLPALLAGLGIGVLAALAARVLLSRKTSPIPGSEGKSFLPEGS